MKSRLNHIALAASDPRRSAQVFEQLLGAAIVLPANVRLDPPEASANLPGVTLVYVEGVNDREKLPVAHIALTVTSEELAACRERLAELGLHFEGPRRGPQGRALYFTDYDNNLFELSTTRLPYDGET